MAAGILGRWIGGGRWGYAEERWTEGRQRAGGGERCIAAAGCVLYSAGSWVWARRAGAGRYRCGEMVKVKGFLVMAGQ